MVFIMLHKGTFNFHRSIAPTTLCIDLCFTLYFDIFMAVINFSHSTNISWLHILQQSAFDDNNAIVSTLINALPHLQHVTPEKINFSPICKVNSSEMWIHVEIQQKQVGWYGTEAVNDSVKTTHLSFLNVFICKPKITGKKIKLNAYAANWQLLEMPICTQSYREWNSSSWWFVEKKCVFN